MDAEQIKKDFRCGESPLELCLRRTRRLAAGMEDQVSKMRKNSIKSTRINGEVRRVLAEIIRSEIKDPRIPQMTSVVAVEVAPDLKTCKAWVSVLGDGEAAKNALAGLRSAEGYIRSQLARQMNLRNTPEIRFILDQSIAYGVKMSKMIDEVNRGSDAQSGAPDEEK